MSGADPSDVGWVGTSSREGAAAAAVAGAVGNVGTAAAAAAATPVGFALMAAGVETAGCCPRRVVALYGCEWAGAAGGVFTGLCVPA